MLWQIQSNKNACNKTFVFSSVQFNSIEINVSKNNYANKFSDVKLFRYCTFSTIVAIPVVISLPSCPGIEISDAELPKTNSRSFNVSNSSMSSCSFNCFNLIFSVLFLNFAVESKLSYQTLLYYQKDILLEYDNLKQAYHIKELTRSINFYCSRRQIDRSYPLATDFVL